MLTKPLSLQLPAQLESPQLEPAQLEPAQLEPAQLEPAQLEPAQLEPAQLEPAQLEPAQLEPAESIEPVKPNAKLLSMPLSIQSGLEDSTQDGAEGSIGHSQDIRQDVIKLLLVEDDPVMQLGLEQFFEDYPQFVIVGQATDGYASIEAARRLQPDIVVMDIGLPQLDGILATQRIKAELPQTRIVMLTSHIADHEMMAALSSGADAYCVKGTRLDQLEFAISSALEGAVYLDPQIARRVLSHLKPTPTDPTADPKRLSARELEVLRLIIDGKSNPEIAALLYLSLSTVKCHVRSIMDKLSVDDRVQAAVVALRSGLV
jgi:two-component system, NarL family, response regulator LiaR